MSVAKAPPKIKFYCQLLAGKKITTTNFDKWWVSFSRWPPNAFALTATLLQVSGAYRMAVSPPDGHVWPPTRGWFKRVARAARKWLIWTDRGAVPSEIRALGAKLKRHLDTDATGIDNHWELVEALLELHAFADAACKSVGCVTTKEGLPHEQDNFITRAEFRLAAYGTLSEIHPSIIRVLPKFRTPQSGITLRSLSQNLSAHRSEVVVDWRTHPTLCDSSEERLNVLIIPWPNKVEAPHFVEEEGRLENMDKSNFRFFRYDPQTKFSVSAVRKLVDEAKKRVGIVHGVVLPECAVPEDKINALQLKLGEQDVRLLVAGAYGANQNYAHLGLAIGGRNWLSVQQHKHHRWCVDDSQIRQYHLGSSLHPSKRWWEHINIHPRQLSFFTANRWLTVCHLICEDLARQEPVSEIVRGVGPTLVIALLMDGPQLISRWPGRYATVFAEDPGCSVLSVTSIGMSERSRPPGLEPSRVIGLWKDRSRSIEQLTLDKNADALLLTLCARWVQEWSADGRSDDRSTAELVLAGVEQIKRPSN